MFLMSAFWQLSALPVSCLSRIRTGNSNSNLQDGHRTVLPAVETCILHIKQQNKPSIVAILAALRAQLYPFGALDRQPRPHQFYGRVPARPKTQCSRLPYQLASDHI
jgi:hypothetical protein